MPEFPDVEVYIDALRARVLDTRLLQIQVNNPFLLRTVAPPCATSWNACAVARPTVLPRR